MNPKVQILLSTYNGEKYLKPQIESILNQTYPNVFILIRDDGSTDSTINILKELNANPNITLCLEENIGIPWSYFKLIQYASEEMDYYAFCDQDDYWRPEKLSAAVEMLEKLPGNCPNLYCSRIELGDQDLNSIGFSKHKSIGRFENCFVSNIATGCSVAFNNKLLTMINKQIPNSVWMHDWWCYQVATAFGNVIYDENSYLIYRQHVNNLTGSKAGTIAHWLRRLERFFGKDKRFSPIVTKQAEEFLRIFNKDMDIHKRDILTRFINQRKTFIGRLLYALFGEIRCQSKMDNFALRILFLLNKI